MMRFDEVLDQCVTDVLAGRSVEECVARYPRYAAELGSLLEVAAALTRVGPVEVSTEAKERGKQRLMAAIARQTRLAAKAAPRVEPPANNRRVGLISGNRFAPKGI